MAPVEVGHADQGVDGIDGAVQHNGVDLSDERADQSEDQGDDDQPTVGADERSNLAKQLEQIHGVVVCVGQR